MLESVFQRQFNEGLLQLDPNGLIVVTDPSNTRSFPDRIFLSGRHWAAFETKRAFNAHKQPNQPYYVNLLNQMSFARFVNPENMEEVLYALELTLQTR